MRFIKIFLTIACCVFVLSLRNSYAGPNESGSIAVVDNYKIFGKIGAESRIGYGQCVDFVKANRVDLQGISYEYAANMPKVLKDLDYEINELPREGAVLVMPNIGDTGHVAIVTKVELKKDGSYSLTIRDANADDKAVYDSKNKIIIKGGKIDQRTVTYKDGVVTEDSIIGDQKDVVFIHEKKGVYNEKKEKALEQVTKVYKNLGKEPND
ncbi:MAG: hypothetical protein COZ68_09365, partial [Deltaproteobacteria bacterium CG_4_8_14_3_um_filter_43_13]